MPDPTVANEQIWNELKLRFKELHGDAQELRNWQIRTHRALSWRKRACDLRDAQPEARFLFLWIALSSLYSRWDAAKNEPDRDGPARRDLIGWMCRADERIVSILLNEQRAVIEKMMRDPGMSNAFWRNPNGTDAERFGTEDARYADANFRFANWFKILNQTLDRLFVLRGQIVHGASTGGSRLNREALSAALEFLNSFVPVAIQVFIEKGRAEVWDDLCYPPLVDARDLTPQTSATSSGLPEHERSDSSDT